MSIRPLLRRARSRMAVIGGALLVTLATVSLLIAAVALVGVLVDADSLHATTYLTVLDCHPLGDKNAALVLFWSETNRGAKAPTQIGTHCLDSGRLTLRVLWPEVHPDCFAASSGGDCIFLADKMGVIYSADRVYPESTLTKIGIQPGKIVRHMELSPDRRFLFSIGPLELCAWDLHARALCWRRDIAVACLASAPGSQSIACGFENGDILELDSHSGQTIRTVVRLPRSVDEVTISSNGQSLACVGADRRVQVFDWTTGAPLWQHDGCANFIGSVHSLCFSPCGRLLVGPTAENPSNLTVWDAQSGEPLNILRGHTKFIMGARFIASDRLVSWGTDGTVRTWDVMEAAEPRVASLIPPLQSS